MEVTLDTAEERKFFMDDIRRYLVGDVVDLIPPPPPFIFLLSGTLSLLFFLFFIFLVFF